MISSLNMVEALEIRTSDRGHSGPIPRSGLDGKFSIAYCAAAALLDGDVGIDTFTDKRRFAGDMEYALPRVTAVPHRRDGRRNSDRDAEGWQYPERGLPGLQRLRGQSHESR